MLKKKYYGLPLPIALVLIVIVFISMYVGALSTDIVGAFALALAIGIVLNEIGNRIPIWNKYVGGGLVLAFLGTAVLVTYNIIPAEYVESLDWVNSDVNFLTLFIIILITGSIMGLERGLLLKSIAGYIPAILGGLAGASLLGVLIGFLFNITWSDVLIRYVFPIMGGGNGAGAVPLSEIYGSITGDDPATYYAFAISILTIANIFAIIAAGLLNGLGQSKPNLTGDKLSLMRNAIEIPESTDKEVKLEMSDYGAAFFLALSFYALGRLFSDFLLPTVFGVEIHQLAYMIIFVVLANAFDLIPIYIRRAATVLQKFFTKNMVLIIMVGVGAGTDLQELVDAITITNVIMAMVIVIGAIFGSALVGYLVGFYPIDSAVTAGLCMANRGGSGDLAVLGAGDRMGLISYAQLSSRLGGGIVLVIASVIFGAFL